MATIEERLAALEAAVASISSEVVTRRLVVADAGGRPRLVAEVRGETVELRLSCRDTSGRIASVLLHASHPDGDLGPLAGVQLWAGGDAVAESDIWPDDGGTWRLHLHADGQP